MSSYFTGKNIVIGVLIFIILLWVCFVGYSALNQKVNPVDPAAPEIIVSKDIFNIGDQIQVKVKHNRTLGKYNVNWQVLDGYSVKHDYISCAADSVIMGTGPVPKVLLVICNINYVENGEIVSYFLSSQIKIGGPIPPPIPPPPVPPEPKPPVPPEPKPAFPEEKLKLSTFSYNEFSKINHADKVRLAYGFANAAESMVAAINAGTKKDSESVLKELNVMNNNVLATLTIDRNVVLPYFAALQQKLIEIDNSIGFEKLDNLKQALKEISVGLKAVK